MASMTVVVCATASGLGLAVLVPSLGSIGFMIMKLLGFGSYPIRDWNYPIGNSLGRSDRLNSTAWADGRGRPDGYGDEASRSFTAGSPLGMCIHCLSKCNKWQW